MIIREHIKFGTKIAHSPRVETETVRPPHVDGPHAFRTADPTAGVPRAPAPNKKQLRRERYCVKYCYTHGIYDAAASVILGENKPTRKNNEKRSFGLRASWNTNERR